VLGAAAIVAFVATSDPAAARAFYAETLGLRFVADEPVALVFDAGATQLRIQKVPGHTPLPYTALGWRVTDIAATVAALASRGARFERFPGLKQDEAGLWLAPDGSRVAWFKDPDGNLLSLTQYPAS
jgi:catechol 2,3-dioxygenase-like lactoylglutathione lyase family enzyme